MPQGSGLPEVLDLSAIFQAVAHQLPDHSAAVAPFLEKRRPAG